MLSDNETEYYNEMILNVSRHPLEIFFKCLLLLEGKGS